MKRMSSKASLHSESQSQASHDQMMDEQDDDEVERIDPEKLTEEEHVMKFHFLALFLERAI